jgi:RNA polymerase sigma factor (sigma-70 family)
VEQSYSKLEATLHRTPTDAEVAADLEMTDAEFQTALRKISFVGVVALDEVFRGGDRSDRSTLGETLPDSTAGPMDTFEVKETKEALIQAVGQMAEREKTVLTLYYYEGLTLAEIGDILGVTESRVCQIHTKAVLQLRAKLADRSPSGCRRPRRAEQRPAESPPTGHRAAMGGAPGGPDSPNGVSGRPATTMVMLRQPAGRSSSNNQAPGRVHGRLLGGVVAGVEQPYQGAVIWPS